MPPRRTARAVAAPIHFSDSDSSISSTHSSPAPAQKASKRTRKAANSRKSDTAPPLQPQINLDHIERGGKAATELWNTLEVRDKILNFVPRGSLPILLRLEKAVTASVSAVLYRSIHVSLMSRMSRASPRRVVYCDCVRTLDRNPLLIAEEVYKRERSRKNPPAKPFDASSTLKELATLRKKYPNLQTILNHYPANTEDDCYILHLSGAEVTVDIETKHTITIGPFPSSGSPLLPEPPVYPGFIVRHSLALRLTGGYKTTRYNYRDPRENSEDVEDGLEKWNDWLFDNPDLDPRVSSIDVENTRLPMLSPVEVYTYLQHRRSIRCEPLRKYFTSRTLPMNPRQFKQMADLLGPAFRELHIRGPFCEILKDWQDMVVALDSGVPLIETLTISSITEPSVLTIPAGRTALLLHLRMLKYIISTHCATLEMTRCLSGIGSPLCYYEVGNFYSSCSKDTVAFNLLIQKLKSRSPENDHLLTANFHDLDLWHINQLSEYEFQQFDGRVKRVAWDKTEKYGSQLSEQEEELERLLEKQKTLVESLRVHLANSAKGLTKAGGDVVVEKALLMKEFKLVAGLQTALGDACDAVKDQMEEIKSKAMDMSNYTREWILEQELEEKRPKAKESNKGAGKKKQLNQ